MAYLHLKKKIIVEKIAVKYIDLPWSHGGMGR